jgi:stage IV sporulation protein FB
MNEQRLPAVMVVDASGHALGMITPENVGELMMIHSALDGRGNPPWFSPRQAVPQEEVKSPS